MSSNFENGEAVSDPLLLFLARMARRGAFVTAPASAELSHVDLLCRRHGTVDRLGEVPAELLDQAKMLNLVEVVGERFILSAAGRAQVRRARNIKISDEVRNEVQTTKTASGNSAAGEPQFDASESPLARLRYRTDKDGQPLITAAQFEAGERLRCDLWLAGLTPKVTQSWDGIPQGKRQRQSPPGTGMHVSDGIVAARERAIRALCAVGQEHIDLLFDVCGHLKGLEEIERTASLPQRSARRFLQMGLAALARHYGLMPPQNVETIVRSRMQHWGGEGYRLPARRLNDSG